MRLFEVLRLASTFLQRNAETLTSIDARLKHLEEKDSLYWKWFARAHGIDPMGITPSEAAALRDTIAPDVENPLRARPR